MSEKTTFNRRQAMKMLAVGGLAGLSSLTVAAPAGSKPIGAMIPGKGWVPASGERGEHDGTPLQFMPKTAPDANPLEDELAKYPRCPYCGMSRKKWNHSRHLVHYDDGLADGTCSIHCAAISLSLNLDRGPKAIYAADFGSDAEIKPLVEVDKAQYLIGAKLKGTMTANSKMAFASVEAAKAAQAAKGGELADFDTALTAAYNDMAKDTMMIRKRRKERVRKMMEKKMKMKQG
ncbi:MAG: nitrous oxide reductase accessory protein NosL [Chromatiales bacterium]|nr:nitrous oxide reductase accessory protein NosL [Chromatiales bacterium]